MFQRAMRKKASGEGGFTLIELLIVIIILGVLAAIVVFAVGGVTDKGDKAACNTEVKTVDVAVEAYYANHTAYPSDINQLTGGGDKFLRDTNTKYVTVLAGGIVTAKGALPAGCTAS